MDNFLRIIVYLSVISVLTPTAHAELTIEISQGVEATMPIAVVPFGLEGAGKIPVKLTAVIQADLNRSGVFKTLAEADMLTKPTQAEKIKFRNWQALGQEYLLIGQITPIQGRFNIQFQLFDVYKGEQLLGLRIPVSAKDLRATAHQISDLVYEKLTGKKGVFSTRLAYVTSVKKTKKSKIYKLIIADADGYNPRTIASSREPIMSPAWSADGKKIAYVSFENKRSAVYIQTLTSGKRSRVAAFKGINGAPAFSPDGRKLALTLSKEGSPDIFVLDLINKSLRKITKSYGIETEPTWSPDGKILVYTSNKGGKPQLYKISSMGGRATRITFEGDYNARGRFSADGKSIAMVHANKGDYRIAVMDVATQTINVLSAGRYDEAPSFSPNGDMILYASRKGRKNVLSAVSVDGKMQQNLAFSNGDVREPAWSP